VKQCTIAVNSVINWSFFLLWLIKRENRSNGLVCGARKNWKKVQ